MEQTKKPMPYHQIIILITALSVIATILVYPSLPDAIPYHWSIGGEVKTVDKWVAYLTALLPVVIYHVSKLSSRRHQTESSRFLVSLVFVIIHWAVIFIAKG